jgi:hypothetical protein
MKMTNNALTDAGVGRALFTTRFMLSYQAAMMCLWVGALPGFVVPYILWFFIVSPHSLDLVKIDIIESMVSSTSHLKWRARDEAGQKSILTVVKSDGKEVQLLTPSQAKAVLKPQRHALDVFHAVVMTSFICSVLAYLLTWFLLRRMGSGNQENKRIRGAKTLVSPNELNRLTRQEGAGPYKIINVNLPRAAPMGGILAQGAQRTGKSLAIHDLMRQVFAKNRKCIIYDQNGEFFKAYYRPGKDFFFNPACIGSVPWSIFAELVNTYDANTLAQAFLPPKAGVVSGPGAFFEDAARALFSVILLRLCQRGARNTNNIAKAILEMPDEEMALLIKNSVASSAVGGDSKSQRQGVMSSISIYLDGIAAVKDGDWSVRDFLNSDDDARFFILGTDDTKAMFAPLYRLLLTVAFDSIAAKQEIVHEDKYWFFLDEVHTLGDIKLDSHLAEKGKFGVCVVTGIQAETQFITSVGKDRMTTIMNCFNTVLMLRANEPDMQDRAARRLGKVEMDTVSRNQALAVTEWRDAAGLNKSESEKWSVMPSQIGDLATCMGYLKLVGEYPVCKVDYRNWLPRRPGARSRIDLFKGVQELPRRDTKFLIHRAMNDDALASVRVELEEAKKAEAAKPKAEAEQPNLLAAAENEQASGGHDFESL